MHYKHILKEERKMIEELTQARSSDKKDSGGAWVVGKYDRMGIEAELQRGCPKLRAYASAEAS